MSSTINKTIHFFWFSGEAYPENIQRCMESWRRVLPDYEIIKWDLSNTPIEGAFAQQALKDEKWAFLSDYARLRVLHEYGGVYLDTDVLLVKSFDELLDLPSFWGADNQGRVEPVVIGAKPKNELIKACLDVYLDEQLAKVDYTPIPQVISSVFELYGIQPNKSVDVLSKYGKVLSHEAFCPMPFEKAEEDPLSFVTSKSYAVHLWNAAWFDPFRFFWNGRRKKGWKAIWRKIRSNPFQGWKFYRNIAYHIKSQIIGYPKS